MGTKITGVHDLQYAWFKRKYFELSGLSLDGYKDSQMLRRIAAFMQNKGFKNYVQFYHSLEKDKNAAGDFKNFLTINVSSFFRDGEKWRELAENFLPEILKKHSFLQIWSAGCSIGCEPYTLAVVCEEIKKMTPFSYSISATDIDEEALSQARAGVFARENMKGMDEGVLGAYFTASGNKWKVKPLLQANITFQARDLFASPNTPLLAAGMKAQSKYVSGADSLQRTHPDTPQFTAGLGSFKSGDEKRYHLILCRNVVIYFEDEAKQKLYRLFSDSLFSGGILFTGGSEIIFQSEVIGLKNLSMSFYQKI